MIIIIVTFSHMNGHHNIHKLIHVFFISYFFIPKVKSSFFSSSEVLRSGSSFLYYMPQAQIFLQPQSLLHR